MIIIVVALGLGLHALKSANPTPQVRNNLNAVLSDDDFAPYTKSEAAKLEESQRAHKNRRLLRNRQQATSLDVAESENEGTMDFGAPPAPPANPGSQEDPTAADEDVDDDDNPCADDDEECQEALAKQKEKENEDANTDDATNSGDQEVAEEDGENDETGSDSNFVTGPGGQAPPPETGDTDQDMDELVKFWLDRLLNQPNFRLASEFAGLVKTKNIDTGVYFAVVDELLIDPREGIQLVGTYLLGSFQSAESFRRLVAAETLAPFGSRVNKQVELYIDAYKKLNNVRFLGTVLNTGTDLTVIRKAIAIVQESARSQLNSNVQTQGTNSGRLTGSDADVFRGFVTVLEDLSNSIGDQQTARLASDALSQLQDILPEEDETPPGSIAENSNPDTNS